MSADGDCQVHSDPLPNIRSVQDVGRGDSERQV